jgi:hypothetical protein
MDKDTIQQIAAEVVARLPFGDRYWLVLIVNAVVAALVGALAVLGTSYFKTRGQNLATKHDFDELLKQQRDTAEAVETIKSEVSQRDWARREWTNLRRVKLEALLDKMHECETYLDRRRNAALGGELAEKERDVVNEFATISTLYFHDELRKEAHDFYIQCKEETIALLSLAQAIAKAGDDMSASQSAFDTFSKGHWPEGRSLARSALTTAARHLLKRIMNVDEPRPSDAR